LLILRTKLLITDEDDGDDDNNIPIQLVVGLVLETRTFKDTSSLILLIDKNIPIPLHNTHYYLATFVTQNYITGAHTWKWMK